MEESSDEIDAVILDEDPGGDAVLVDEVIHVLALDGFLLRGFLFIQNSGNPFLLNEDLHRVDEVLDASVIAAFHPLLADINRADRIIEARLGRDVFDIDDVLKAIRIFPYPFLIIRIEAVLDQLIDLDQEHSANAIIDEAGADEGELLEIRGEGIGRHHHVEIAFRVHGHQMTNALDFIMGDVELGAHGHHASEFAGIEFPHDMILRKDSDSPFQNGLVVPQVLFIAAHISSPCFYPKNSVKGVL